MRWRALARAPLASHRSGNLSAQNQIIIRKALIILTRKMIFLSMLFAESRSNDYKDRRAEKKREKGGWELDLFIIDKNPSFNH